MCEKAEEIQKIWKPRVGDLAWRGTKYLPTKDACGYLTDVDVFDTQGYKARGSVWLPRQDQLQEMVKSDTIINWDFYHFINDGLTDYLDYFNSMEQLWLAFVMKEKHNKTWDGEDWIKE